MAGCDGQNRWMKYIATTDDGLYYYCTGRNCTKRCLVETGNSELLEHFMLDHIKEICCDERDLLTIIESLEKLLKEKRDKRKAEFEAVKRSL